MKCITEFSVHPSGSVLYFLYADPPVWVLIVSGTLPRLRALADSDELLLHNARRLCLLEKRMNCILLCLSSLSIENKALLFWPFLNTLLSQCPWTSTEWISWVAELWCKRLVCSIFMNRTNRNWSDLCYPWFCFPKQICYKTREAGITFNIAASQGCTKTTDQAESQVSGLFHWLLLQSSWRSHSNESCITEMSHHKKDLLVKSLYHTTITMSH